MLQIDVDADALRRDSDIVAPSATASDIRAAIRHLAVVELQQALATATHRPSIHAVR
ncbi:MAG: hypothetical protein ACRDDJ_02350 [[Mycobacterium] stephanolepidis]